MFRNEKDQLKTMLVESWNLLATARGEALEYSRSRGGWDWYVILDVVDASGADRLLVHQINSEQEGAVYVRQAVAAPQELYVSYVKRSYGPMIMSTQENFAYQTANKWLERLSSSGKSHPVPSAWRDD